MNGRRLGTIGWNMLRSGAVVAVMGMGMGCDIPDGNGNGIDDPGLANLYDCDCTCTSDISIDTEHVKWLSYCALDDSDAFGKCDGFCTTHTSLSGYKCKITIESPTVYKLDDPICVQEPGSPGARVIPNTNDGVLDYSSSTATVTYAGGTPINMHVAGEVSFTGGCETSVGPSATASCPSPIVFNEIYLVPDDFAIPTPMGTFNMTSMLVTNRGDLSGTQSGRGFQIPGSQVHIAAHGDLNGIPKAVAFDPSPNEDVLGIHVPSTRLLGFSGQFTALDGDLTLTLNLNGTMTARPPVADAGESQTVSCNPLTGTGSVLLDGRASSDIDGNLYTVAWYDENTLLGTGMILNATFGVGNYTIKGVAWDTTQKFNAADTTVTVLHDAPPVFNASASITVPTCTPGLVILSTPQVTDLCSVTSPSVTGEIVEINGTVLVNPIPVDTITGAVALPAGTAIVVWTASTDGGTSTFEQTIEVSSSADVSCCGPTQVLYEGTAAADSRVDPNASTGYCMFGYDAKDRLQSGAFADFISGGPGDDMLKSQGGDDVIVGGDGDDDITYNGNGTVVIGGGDGNDRIHLAFGPTSYIFAGAGNDQVTCDGGNDTIYPGPGRDTIRAGSGNDTVIFRNVCELDSNKLLNGGAGDDTLILPVPLPSLNGVNAIGFEHIVVDATKSHLAECP